ncbi:DUF5808 domain-containing protein [Streptacidiphilus anmyonensis]|uniref:DUF5808 domain-containing protein n=1 Tax=Streptacidiphilus anmyonensis TaxID=405782 RepID=UPI0005A888B1
MATLAVAFACGAASPFRRQRGGREAELGEYDRAVTGAPRGVDRSICSTRRVPGQVNTSVGLAPTRCRCRPRADSLRCGELEATAVSWDDDDRHWKVGQSYVSPDDRRVLVPKRMGFGRTLNFASPWPS